MARVISHIGDLASRGKDLSRILGEICTVKPAWQPRSRVGEYVIGLHSGAPAQSDYRDWRFPTFVAGVHAMYFELWRVLSDTAHLDRAYLSLFRTAASGGEQELLALHCDPNEPDGAEHAVYKQGPHLHLATSEVPGPHSHIALNRCHLEEVLKSRESFTRALHLALIMLRDEVLGPLRD